MSILPISTNFFGVQRPLVKKYAHVLATMNGAGEEVVTATLPIVFGSGNIITSIRTAPGIAIDDETEVDWDGELNNITTYNIDTDPEIDPEALVHILYTTLSPTAQVPGRQLGFPLIEDSVIYVEAPAGTQAIIPILIEYYGEANPSQN